MIIITSFPKNIEVYECKCGTCNTMFECTSYDFVIQTLTTRGEHTHSSHSFNLVQCPICGKFVAKDPYSMYKDDLLYSTEKKYFGPSSNCRKINTERSYIYQDYLHNLSNLKNFIDKNKNEKKGEDL